MTHCYGIVLSMVDIVNLMVAYIKDLIRGNVKVMSDKISIQNTIFFLQKHAYHIQFCLSIRKMKNFQVRP